MIEVHRTWRSLDAFTEYRIALHYLGKNMSGYRRPMFGVLVAFFMLVLVATGSCLLRMTPSTVNPIAHLKMSTAGKAVAVNHEFRSVLCLADGHITATKISKLSKLSTVKALDPNEADYNRMTTARSSSIALLWGSVRATQTIDVFSLKKGRVVSSIHVPSVPSRVVLSPDGKLLAVTFSDLPIVSIYAIGPKDEFQSMYAINLQTSQKCDPSKIPNVNLSGQIENTLVTFFHDKLLAICDVSRKSVFSWDISKASLLHQSTLRQNAVYRTISISESGQLLAIGGSSLSIFQFPECVLDCERPVSERITSIVFIDDDKRVITGFESAPLFGQSYLTRGTGGSVTIWSLEGTRLRTIRLHPYNVKGLHYFPRNRRLLSWGDDGIKMWDILQFFPEG